VEPRILTEAERLALRLAMNAVFGRFFDVLPVEAADPSALRERTGEPFFIFDVQVYYVGSGYDPDNVEAGRKGAVTKQGLLGLRKGAQRMNPQLATDRGTCSARSSGPGVPTMCCGVPT
jgi:hypothetical protein